MSTGALPGAAKRFLVLVGAAAATAATAAAATQLPERGDLLPFGVLVAAAAVSQLFTVRTGRSHGFHTALAFVVAGALLLPPSLLVVLVLVQHLPEWLKERYPWYIQTFNIANYVLNALAASTVASAVAASVDGGTGFALAGAAACAAFVGTNHALLAAMLVLARRRSLRETQLLTVRSLGTDLVLGGVGVVIAYISLENAWLLPAAAAPLFLSHRSHSLLADLRTSEERFRTMFEHAGVGIALYALDGRILTANPAFAKMLEYDREELLALSVGDYADPDSADEERALFAATVAGDRDLYRLETPYRSKRGRVAWANVSASLVRDAGRRPRFVIAMVEDITERKTAAEALRESEERYRELFENANDVVFTIDDQAHLTAVNAAAEKLTGYDAGEMVGKSIADLFAPETRDVAMGQLASKIVGQPAATHEWTMRTRDGRDVVLEVACAPVRRGGRIVGVQGIARDLSERKELEEQLRQAQKMDAIGRLAGGIAHDFNNLMTAITGYSEVALQRSESGQSDRRELEEIQNAANRATRLTRQLLAFSRKQVLQPTRIDINEIVRDMQKMLARVIGDDIEIATSLDPEVGMVEADRSQLEQVLLNLAVNARDAMPAGGVVRIATANVDVDGYSMADPGAVPAGQYVQLTVSDTGIGMDEPTAARAFEPFFTTKPVGKGTGLGLATVYGIVNQTGGFTTIESAPGAGTTFRVYLHRLANRASAPDLHYMHNPPRGSERILLVEDDDAVREIAVGILERSGYTVTAASDGIAALDALGDGAHVDLLVSDVVMPRLDGPALADRLLEDRPQLKVLFMSGYSEAAVGTDGTLRPGTHYLEKPFTSAMLAAKVRDVLDSQPAMLVA